MRRWEFPDHGRIQLARDVRARQEARNRAARRAGRRRACAAGSSTLFSRARPTVIRSEATTEV